MAIDHSDLAACLERRIRDAHTKADGGSDWILSGTSVRSLLGTIMGELSHHPEVGGGPAGVIRVGQLAAWFREHKIGIFERQPPTASEHEAYGYVLNAEALAESILEDITGKAHPMPAPSRWPMTRGDLATRLSLALEGMPVAVSTVTGTAVGAKIADPAYTASQLVDAIGAQGTEEDGHAIGLDGECGVCGGENGRHIPLAGTADGPPLPMPPDAPYPLVTEYPDLTAAATIIRELEALSGTSGAGWDHMVNVLRFAAGHFGYEIAEQDT